VEIVGMHQPGVSRHLKVLRDAGLVAVRLADWLEPYRAEWADRLDALERHLERTSTAVERAPDGGLIRFDRRLAFPIEEVWSAITEADRLADWWAPFAADITVDLREGGSITFDWHDHDVPTFEFEILRLQAPTLLEHTHIVALTLPGSDVQLMLDAHDPTAPVGPIFVVESVAAFHAARPAGLSVVEEPVGIPGAGPENRGFAREQDEGCRSGLWPGESPVPGTRASRGQGRPAAPGRAGR